MNIKNWPRHTIQALWAALTNSHISGFVTGKIYTGKLKNACVPGLNCYSCPGAAGACPIGSLQAVVGSWNFKFAYYVIGFLIFVGAILGRLVCGFLCPFGLIQDLLNKIPFPKKIRTFKGDKLLRKLKYVIFLVFVILLPLFLTDIMGQGAPYFCKLICPAGTLEGGLPLVLLNKAMRGAIGWLYIWKNAFTVENVQRLARWWSTLWKTPTVRNVSVADGVSRHVRYTPLRVGARDNRNVFTIFMGINFMYVL